MYLIIISSILYIVSTIVNVNLKNAVQNKLAYLLIQNDKTIDEKGFQKIGDALDDSICFYTYIPILNLLKDINLIMYGKYMAQDIYETLEDNNALVSYSPLGNESPEPIIYDLDHNLAVLASKEETKDLNMITSKVISSSSLSEKEKLIIINAELQELRQKMIERSTKEELIELTLKRSK